MAEPARKLEDETQPYERSIPGRGNNTQERAQSNGNAYPGDELAARRKLRQQEENPEKLNNNSIADKEEKGSNVLPGPWENNVSGVGPLPVTPAGKLSLVKNIVSGLKGKGPSTAVITMIVVVAILIGMLFGGASAPLMFVKNVVDDLNDQLASLDMRNMSMMKNKVPSAMRDTALEGCKFLSIRCKFRTMSMNQVEKYSKAGIDANYGETTITKEITRPDSTKLTSTETRASTSADIPGEVTKGNIKTITEVVENKTIFGRAKPTSFEYHGKVMGAEEFAAELKTNNSLRIDFKRGINMKTAGFSDDAFNWVLDKFGISRKPPELRGTKEERVKALSNRVGGNIDDINFVAVDEEGKPLPADADIAEATNFKLQNEVGVEGTPSYTKADTISMNKAVAGVKAASAPPSRLQSDVLKGLSILGALDLACSVNNLIGAASIAAKVANSIQLAKYAMPVASLVGQMQAGDISEENAQAVGEFFTQTDNRRTINAVSGSSTSDVSLDAVENPNFGKSAMDSDLYQMSVTGKVASNSTDNNQYSLGMGASTLLSGFSNFSVITTTILNLGTDNGLCHFVQSWFVRGAGLIVGVAAMVGSSGSSLALQAGIFAAVFTGFLILSNVVHSALSGSMFASGMEDAPVERGAATWTGLAVINGEAAKSRGMIPGNSKQIVAYNQLQNSSKLDYIAMESEGVSPLDVSNQYSFLGTLAMVIGKFFNPSSNNLASSIGGISSLVSSSFSTALNPQSLYADTIDTSRFKKCDDKDYQKLGIDADVQCNIRYIMPTEDLALDTDDVARYMEEQGYVETDTTTGLPADYTLPKASETQNFAMQLLNGFVGSFYNQREYGKTPQAKEYGQFLDYCVYRAMPFGGTYEEHGAWGAADPGYVDGSNCMKTGAPYSYFRIYTFDLTVNAALDNEGI